MTIDRFVDPDDGDADAPAEGFLASRTALVTGAARRVGRALALALAAEGAHVVIHHHTAVDEAKALAKEIRHRGGSADVLPGDLADAAVARALPARAAELSGNPLDILVNNAAGFVRADFAATDAATWDRLHAVNLRAPFLLAQGFAAQLPAKWTGDIVNLNDARSLVGDPEHFAYAVAKVGLQGLTRNLARALAPRIEVNEIALGAVLAPDAGDYLHTTRDELPAGRFPHLDEVISAMMFILGTRGVSGQTIRIDGGQFLA
ncbi:SDR family oxidoreductase [bacterium]|nr:SDR family oxidoreductase [bacterium]